jgi:hypothetical protein
MSWWDFLTQASTPSWLGEKAKWITPQEQQGFANMLERVKQGIVPPGMQGQQDPRQPFTSEQIQSAIPYITGAAPIAYHGSPHQFEKFSMEKIGTGEGAQSYGHGLYFAENPEVAGTYLQGPRVYKHIETGQTADSRQLSFDQITSGKWKPQPSQQGHFYQVNIPDEHVAKMLDWDKPLLQQSPDVLDKLKQAFPKLFESQGLSVGSQAERMTGEHLYKLLVGMPGFNEGFGSGGVSMNLNKLGIPGIKYLDQGSRGLGNIERSEGGYGDWIATNHLGQIIAKDRDRAKVEQALAKMQTRNFVVFDENILKDVKRQTEGKIAELAGRK